jgi:translation initiation factor 2A
LYLDRKTNEGNVALYSGEKDEPIYEKFIKKAEEIKLKFNPNSNQFLMELQTYYDPTGKSYYGEYGLYIYNDLIKKITRVVTAKGPVHDFSWDKKG